MILIQQMNVKGTQKHLHLIEMKKIHLPRFRQKNIFIILL